MTDGRAVCSCLNLHIGDPLIHCHRVECQSKNEIILINFQCNFASKFIINCIIFFNIVPEDCPSSQICSNNHCVNACDGVCGINANCDAKNHVPTCSCPPGYSGDPFKSCHIADPRK